MDDAELEVLGANEAFYQAFAGGDLDRMDELWARAAPVSCIHPGWSALVGRERVMASWRAILRAGNRIEASGARAFLGGGAGYVVCFEGEPGDEPILVATNIFVHEDGRWRMVHHHAGQLAHPPEIASSGPTN
jgi:SnoaL-like protein